MTDLLIQKLEEKVMALVSEIDNVRRELRHVRSELNQMRHENGLLKNDKINYVEKLQGLVALLDGVEITEDVNVHEYAVAHSRMETAEAV